MHVGRERPVRRRAEIRTQAQDRQKRARQGRSSGPRRRRSGVRRLHGQGHRGARGAGAGPAAARHVCRRDRRARAASSRGRGAGQRHGRGRGRPRQLGRVRAGSGRRRHRARQRPRHPGRPPSQDQGQVRPRSHHDHAALRRKVRWQRLQDLGRSARRWDLGGQRALGPDVGRGGARPPALAPGLQPRHGQDQAQESGHGTEPARHDHHLPPGPGDLWQVGGVQTRPALPHGALEGLSDPGRGDPLGLRQVAAGRGIGGAGQGDLAFSGRAAGLSRGVGRRPALLHARAVRRGERDQRRRPGRVGGLLARRRERLPWLLCQHGADAAGRQPRGRPAHGAGARPARLWRAGRYQAGRSDHHRGRHRWRLHPAVAVHSRARIPGSDQGTAGHALGPEGGRERHPRPLRPLAVGRSQGIEGAVGSGRGARRGTPAPAPRAGDGAQVRHPQAAPAGQAGRLRQERRGRHRDLPGRRGFRRRLGQAGAPPRHPGGAAAARQDPERGQRLG